MKDHRGIPARGIDNLSDFAKLENLLAVFGGVHTPVALAELPMIHKHKIIYLDPWAAGTSIVANNYKPNYVFRVSIRDEYAGEFLVSQALAKGHTHIGLLLEQTGWGRSNEKAMRSALERRGLSPASVHWFHWGTVSFEDILNELRQSNVDVVLLVSNAPEGAHFVQQVAQLPSSERISIISHWGITGGTFHELTKSALKHIDLSVLQTYSFHTPDNKNTNSNFLKKYHDKFLVRDTPLHPNNVVAPTGTAHAYDLLHLLAKAVAVAGSVERPQVRSALEQLGTIEGLVRTYAPAFTKDDHDALDRSDFQLCRYSSLGVLLPLKGEYLE